MSLATKAVDKMTQKFLAIVVIDAMYNKVSICK